MASIISTLGFKIKDMARRTNNELSALPGFFFNPREKLDLEKLSFEDRCTLVNNQGHTNDPFMVVSDREEIEGYLTDMRIPTHRRPGVPLPEFGEVPTDLRGVIEDK